MFYNHNGSGGLKFSVTEYQFTSLLGYINGNVNQVKR